MQPINSLFEAQKAQFDAFSRLAFATLRWSSAMPARTDLYAWRCGVEGPELVRVQLREDFQLWVAFDPPAKPMSLIEVMFGYPASEWARVDRGGKHESA